MQKISRCWRCKKPNDFLFMDDSCICTTEQLEEHRKKMDEDFNRQFSREPTVFKPI